MATVYADAGYSFARAVDIRPTAEKLQALAKIQAARHIDTGNYEKNLKVVKSRSHEVTQYHVVATDPAATDIEWGHFLVYFGQPTNRWIPGQFILAESVAAMGRSI